MVQQKIWQGNHEEIEEGLFILDGDEGDDDTFI